MDLLVVVAMKTELESLLKKYSSVRMEDFSFPIYKMLASGKKIFIIQSGIGPVETAFRIGEIFSTFTFNQILLVGVAGALDEQLLPGDIVIADQIIQHDCYFSDGKTHLMAPGKEYLSLSPEKRESPFLKCSLSMNQKIQEYFKSKKVSYHYGGMLSGNSFIADLENKSRLKQLANNILALDMESGAIAQLSKLCGIEFTVVKVIADTMNKDSNMASEYLDLLKDASDNATLSVEVFLV